MPVSSEFILTGIESHQKNCYWNYGGWGRSICSDFPSLEETLLRFQGPQWPLPRKLTLALWSHTLLFLSPPQLLLSDYVGVPLPFSAFCVARGICNWTPHTHYLSTLRVSGPTAVLVVLAHSVPSSQPLLSPNRSSASPSIFKLPDVF